MIQLLFISPMLHLVLIWLTWYSFCSYLPCCTLCWSNSHDTASVHISHVACCTLCSSNSHDTASVHICHHVKMPRLQRRIHRGSPLPSPPPPFWTTSWGSSFLSLGLTLPSSVTSPPSSGTSFQACRTLSSSMSWVQESDLERFFSTCTFSPSCLATAFLSGSSGPSFQLTRGIDSRIISEGEPVGSEICRVGVVWRLELRAGTRHFSLLGTATMELGCTT